MSKRIYRAYLPTENFMGEPFDIIDELNNIDSGSFPEGAIILQCIGLHDSEGTLIFEGDIVEFMDESTSNIIRCPVEWVEHNAAFRVIHTTEAKIRPSMMKVVGNIYQNKL